MSLSAADLPLGDLQFFDNHVPALAVGAWTIEVGHTVDGVDTGGLGTRQKMLVTAPQFALDPAAVSNLHPPAGSTGRYAEELPHVVLSDALIPWERDASGPGGSVTPWLALLVLEDGDLVGGTGSPTRSQTSTVADFLAASPGVLKPAATPAADVLGSDPCQFVQVSADRFAALTPRASERRFLAHCRLANIADKAGRPPTGSDGLFSVVVGNRFPAAPPPGASGSAPSIAHLVSLEGLEAYLVDAPDFGGNTSVALVSLASWTFNTIGEPLQDFAGLAANLVGDGRPDELWLRLPAPASPIDTGSPTGAEAARRLADGFVPLSYRVRTGEQTLAWYRGPCAPVLTAALPDDVYFATADSALAYQSSFGVFDASLAGAWETGRALALADRAFGQALFDLRRRGRQLTDTLLQRLTSDAFSADAISALDGTTLVEDEFLGVLSADLLHGIGAVGASPVAAPGAIRDTDPAGAVRSFLADPEVQALIADQTQTDLVPVATWLARLRLLQPLPLAVLTPDARLLPPESIRFFYVDGNWLRAATDGALSIGAQSSRDSFFTEVLGGVIDAAAATVARTLRAQTVGGDASAPPPADQVVSGFLVRSAMVSGWPNLAVRPQRSDDVPLPVLRLDRLADDLLLCLVAGVPDHVEFAEPQEGFRFGVEDRGALPMRQPVTDATHALGDQLASPLTLLPDSLRPGDDRVLSVDDAVRRISQALSDVGMGVSDFGPADFALQMLKTPQAVRFVSRIPSS